MSQIRNTDRTACKPWCRSIKSLYNGKIRSQPCTTISNTGLTTKRSAELYYLITRSCGPVNSSFDGGQKILRKAVQAALPSKLVRLFAPLLCIPICRYNRSLFRVQKKKRDFLSLFSERVLIVDYLVKFTSILPLDVEMFRVFSLPKTWEGRLLFPFEVLLSMV